MGTASVEAIEKWPAAGPEADPSRCSDMELTRRVAAGDTSALEEVYRRHHRLVYGLCLRMTQNVAEAEDLTQEVFVLLFRTLGSFRGESAFTTWLHRLTVNRVLMHFRSLKRRRDEVTGDGEMPEPYLQPVGAATRLPLFDHVALNRAIAQLPPGYRAVFVLHDVEGYHHDEIARIIGCAPGTSKSQLHKARMKLRELLGTPRPGRDGRGLAADSAS